MGDGADEVVCADITLPEHYFTADHEAFVFIAADSGAPIANEHVISGVRLRDFKEHAENADLFSNPRDRIFSSKDLFRMKALQDNSAHTVEAYNSQQIRHNRLYSQLVAEFISNSERIVNNLHSLPQHDVATKLKEQMEGLSQRFGLLSSQFEGYEKDLREYKDFVNE